MSAAYFLKSSTKKTSTPCRNNRAGNTGDAPIHYSDYIGHYTLDAYEMPLPEELGHFRRSLEKRRNRLVAGLVDGPRGGRVLDAGTGAGLLAGMLVRRGYRVVASDLGFDSLHRAGNRLDGLGLPAKLVLGDLYRLPFADGSFDAAAVSEVLEHLETPEAALAELARVLRPGGVLAVSTPYREIIPETLCIHCNRKTPVNAHLHSLDGRSMGALLESAGFRVRRIVTFLNRPAERMGLAGLTSFLPYGVWRTIDSAACAVLGRRSYMAAQAVRNV